MTKLKIWGRNNSMNVQKTMWGAAQITLRMDRIVTSNCSGARWFPGLCILAWRDHCMGVSGGNRLVAFTGVVRPIRSNATDVLIGWNLVQKFG